MDEQQKFLANKAIEENVEDTTARQVIRYVMACELWSQDTISPSNEYLGKKYGWSNDTTKVAISKAKRSQFITTTGYGKKRCLELNVGFLKGKMAEMYQKSLKPRADFSDVLPNTLPTTLPNGSPNSLPNSFEEENAVPKPQNGENGGYSNRNNNKNTSVATAPQIVEVSDSEERPKKESRAKYPHSKEVFSTIFAATYDPEWDRHTTYLQKAEWIYTKVTAEDSLQDFADWLKRHSKCEFFPQADTPSEMFSKWAKFERHLSECGV